MSVTDHIRETTEKFFLCTHIPIRTFSFDGNLIHSVGYNRTLEELFDKNNIYDRMKTEIIANGTTCSITITCADHVAFTASRICSKNLDRGIHILGPYGTHRKTAPDNILYKPAGCIPHLLSLLGNIAADSAYLKQKKKRFHELPYSLNIKRAMDCLDARYHEPITLDDVAKSLNLSKCYLCSLFKKETGKTFSQLLNEIRIEKSKELLLNEKLSMLDIALSVGFNNQNYYNVMFKKLIKYTPLEFRNNRLCSKTPAVQKEKKLPL